eukprot:tig00000057_g95.t1
MCAARKPWKPAVHKDHVPGNSINPHLDMINPEDWSGHRPTFGLPPPAPHLSRAGRQHTEYTAKDRPIKDYWESLGYAGPEYPSIPDPEAVPPPSQRPPTAPAYGAPTPAQLRAEGEFNRQKATRSSIFLGYEEVGPLGPPQHLRRR